MQGSNSLTFCHAQMVEAVECYLNDYIFQKGVRVKEIKYSDYAFEVFLADEADNQKK